jgi:hypothetical protein
MRTIILMLGLLMTMPGLSSLAAAQGGSAEWELFTSKEDGFKVDFPGAPKVTASTWKTEQGYTLPARIFSAERGRERYAITVVDFSGIEEMGIARNKACPSGAETCQGQMTGVLRPLIGPGYAIQDIRAAMTNAAFRFIQRDAKVTAYVWNWQDLVEGFELHLTNNADQSKTMAYIAMHENKLYVLEGTVPDGYPEPGLFFQSLGWVDRDGNGIRYEALYINQMHGLRLAPVPPVRRGAPGAPLPDTAPPGSVR